MNSAFFTANRARLLEALGGQAVVVATAYREMQRSNDASFLFAQEANFRYLTGITAPDWRLIIDGYHDRSYAVMPEVDAIKQVFDGSLSAEQAQQVSGVDEVIDSEQASVLLRRLAKKTKTVHIVDQSSRLASAGFVLNPAHSELREQMGRYFRETKNCFVELARLRAIKQPVEIAALQRAIDITVDGFRILRAELDTYRHEYEAEARLHYEFRRVGAQGHAYDPIVGDGEHAPARCIMWQMTPHWCAVRCFSSMLVLSGRAMRRMLLVRIASASRLDGCVPSMLPCTVYSRR